MNEYYFLIRPDGSMVWKGSGHGPAVYHSIKSVKQYAAHQFWNDEIRKETRILHMMVNQGQHVQTQWLGWAELDEY